MVKQSASRSVGQRSRTVDSLIDSAGSEDSSVNPEQTSIGGNERSDVDSILRVINNNLQNNTNLQKKEEAISRETLNHDSSNGSSESVYSVESDSDISLMYAASDDDVAGYEDALQMGCMDVFFLPQKAKQKHNTNSLFKLNKEGKKELNINLKGPLALGFAKMKKEAEKRNFDDTMSLGSVLQDTISCGNPGGRQSKVRQYDNRSSREQESDAFQSLMSLSHGSSEEDEDDCHNSVVPVNLVLPPPAQPYQNQRQHSYAQAGLRPHYNQQQLYQNYHQQQQYQRQEYQQQQYYHHMNQQQQQQQQSYNAAQNNQRVPQKRQVKPFESPLSTASMPSQIMVGGQERFFEEESYLSYEAGMAPDPPPSSLAKIVEDDYPESSSEVGSDSSMVACGSTISETQHNPSFDTPVQKTAPKKGGRSKVERWRKANTQRLRGTFPIKEDPSVDSDQATYSSQSTTSVVSKNNAPKKDPEGESLVFDSIFTRRIERRRAAKLKTKNCAEEKPFDAKSESASVRRRRDASRIKKKNSVEKNLSDAKSTSVDLKSQNFADNPVKTKESKSRSRMEFHHASENSNALEMSRNDNIVVNGIDSVSSHDGIPEPMNAHDEVHHSAHDSFVIEAVAAAAALALNKDFQPMEKKKPASFDKEDTENMVPPPPPPIIVKAKGKKDSKAAEFPSKPKSKKNTDANEDNALLVRRQNNPFADDDVFDEEEPYDDEAYDHPLLTTSSSDDADAVLQPVLQINTLPLSPFQSTRSASSHRALHNRTVPMTPSPRKRSSRQVDPSPRNYDNGSMHSLSSRMASTKLERCPSGAFHRTDSFKCASPGGDIETEFFEANMYIS